MVTAAGRKGIPMGALMKMRWVVTMKPDKTLKARLVVQGFTDTRLGKIPTASPTASRRARQLYLTTVASLGFQCHKGDVRCAFLQGDLNEQQDPETAARDLPELAGHAEYICYAIEHACAPGCLGV